MNAVRWGLALSITYALASGCSGPDAPMADGDGGPVVDGGDGGPVVDGGDGGPVATDCVGAADGTDCGAGRICVADACTLSRCGDGVIDPATGEDCDDANETALDGCEDDCELTCSAHADCDDGSECTGMEVCGIDHVCAGGTALANGAPCTQAGGEPGLCSELSCLPAGCGDGTTSGDEACDDGNSVDADGCDADCTFSCTVDADCGDGSMCTGVETCDVVTHQCADGETLACDDASPCTANVCEPETGCAFPLIDPDGDGHASTAFGACGDDCNEGRADVYTGAPELCDDSLDSDCDGENEPDSAPFWYVDCDGDDYAAPGADSQQRCTAPRATICGGGWTARVPLSRDRTTFDCNDANANVRPNQGAYSSRAIEGASSTVDYDYNCDLIEQRRFTRPVEFLGCESVCLGDAGWASSTIPSCGATGTYSSCVLTSGVCARLNTTRTQTCR